MTKSDKPIQTKSMLPILVGAIAAPLIINLLFLLLADSGPYGIVDIAFFIFAPAVFGAIIGVVSRLITKTKWGAILLTLIVLSACNLSLVLLMGA